MPQTHVFPAETSLPAQLLKPRLVISVVLESGCSTRRGFRYLYKQRNHLKLEPLVVYDQQNVDV